MYKNIEYIYISKDEKNQSNQVLLKLILIKNSLIKSFQIEFIIKKYKYMKTKVEFKKEQKVRDWKGEELLIIIHFIC